jgi:sortase B
MRKAIFVAAAVILAAAILLSGYQLWRYYTTEKETAEQFDGLTEQIQTPAPAGTPGANEPEQPDEPPPEWTVYDQYGMLFDQNPDMTGWIAIDGTTIDYPVMQSKDSLGFYLTHGIDGATSKSGVPYADERCEIHPQSDNIIVYGHHMKSGAMFGALESYKKEAFYREHPVIRFDTRAGFGRYKILAVLAVNPAVFPYHQFVNAADQAEFVEYVRQCKALSFYDTGVTAEYGDKLLTLSTCEYSAQGNRLVVVARKIEEDNSHA